VHLIVIGSKQFFFSCMAPFYLLFSYCESVHSQQTKRVNRYISIILLLEELCIMQQLQIGAL